MNGIIVSILILMFAVTVCAEENAVQRQMLEDDLEMEALSFDRVFDKITMEEAAPLTSSVTQLRVENEFYYVVILALLCLISLSIVMFFLVKIKQDVKAKDIVSSAGLIIIVFGTIILVLIVDTTEQLTAAIGILGAISGYLFRTAQEVNNEPKEEREK